MGVRSTEGLSGRAATGSLLALWLAGSGFGGFSGGKAADGRPLLEGGAVASAQLEEIRGFAVTDEGLRVRTILTRPQGTVGRLPAILFVQWLSCDPVEVAAEAQDGWSRMLLTMMERSGMVFARTEKPGLGDSEGGPCSELDYLTELSAHRAALAALLRSPWVDPERVYLYGASMGGTMVPLLAPDVPGLRGIIVWGSTGISWAEHMVRLDRRVLELRGGGPEEVAAALPGRMEVDLAYLIRGDDPAQFSSPQLVRAWRETLGADAGTLYGRPVRFHQQAQEAGWESAWGRVRAPVLVVRGEYDWIMSREEHERIVDIVNRVRPDGGTFVEIPRTDHNFVAFSSASDAFAGAGGRYEPTAAQVMLSWLQGRPIADSNGGFSTALAAPAPADSLAERLHAFGRLVGSWDLEVTYHPDDEPSFTIPGEWHFSWVLEGRGVQDVWRVPSQDKLDTSPLRGLGTTVRVFDETLGAWRSTWISSLSNSVTRFIGREVGDELILEVEGADRSGELYRWVFFEVGSDSFRWRAESSTDQGGSWRLAQEMRATRRLSGGE